MFPKIALRTAIAATSIMLGNILCKDKKQDIYIWGNGNYQARPDALLQFKNFSPKKILNLPVNLISLHFGEYFEAGIDDKGNLFIWDKHEVDANLNDDNHDETRNNIKHIKSNVKTVRFTQGYLWVLDNSNQVHQWPIIKTVDSNNLVKVTLGEQREVEPLKGTVQLETGRDHLLTMNTKGEVYAMGDDTYGQCGQADTLRSTSPPYQNVRIKFPTLVKGLPLISEIRAGLDHNLAVDRMGNLYGWGSNSNLQISHEEEFSKKSNPLACSFTPLKIVKNLDGKIIDKVVCGGEFNIITTKDVSGIGYEAYSFGNNLRGQLGIEEIKHFKDVSKIEKLSNFVIKINGEDKKVAIDQIQCGSGHCIALLNIGYVMEWGDNEHGQMGNKKRSPCLSPILLRNFVGKNVVGVFAGETNSGVIVNTENEK